MTEELTQEEKETIHLAVAEQFSLIEALMYTHKLQINFISDLIIYFADEVDNNKLDEAVTAKPNEVICRRLQKFISQFSTTQLREAVRVLEEIERIHKNNNQLNDIQLAALSRYNAIDQEVTQDEQ